MERDPPSQAGRRKRLLDGRPCGPVAIDLESCARDDGRHAGKCLHELDDQGRETGLTRPVPIGELPVRLPELDDYRPSGNPEPPLAKARDWVEVTRDGRRYRRETNTMPQWAGSCWYFLRFCDPANDRRPWSFPTANRFDDSLEIRALSWGPRRMGWQRPAPPPQAGKELFP